MKGLLSLRGIPSQKIQQIVETALQFKNGEKRACYSDVRMATLFFENSTRTQYSFHMAMLNLGIQPLSINLSTSSVNKGESLYDTAKTLECIGVGGLVIRHSENRFYDNLQGIEIPIFNAGDGSSDHPTQTLLDFVTIYEEFGRFAGLKVCIVGDIVHSRVAHGNAELMKRLGMQVHIAGPAEFLDDTADVISLDEAIETCDIIMLLRVQFERHKELMHLTVSDYHEQYGLDEARAARMKPTSIIMHPAPINRGVEISNEVAECSKSRIFVQMKNGVYARMAAISMALEGEL